MGGSEERRPEALATARRLLRPLMAAVALAFVAFAARDLMRRWQGGRVEVDWLLVTLSALPLLFGGVVLALSWKYLIERMGGKRVPLGPALALHAESQLARYTPGKVGIPMVRMAGADTLGIPAHAIATSIVIELLSFTAVGGATGLCLLAFTTRSSEGVLSSVGSAPQVLFAVFGLLVLAMILIDRRRWPSRWIAWLKLEGEGPLVPRRLPLLHLLYWLTWAAHGYLVCLAVGGSPAHAFSSSGLFIVAPVVGFLALVAPAGAGVREAMLSVGLAPVLGPAPALGALIASRALTLLADVILWLGLRPLGRASRR